MSLFGKVLYATDFSPLAEFSLEFLKKLGEAGTEYICVVHVVNDLSTELPDGTDLLGDDRVVSVLPESDRDYIISMTDGLNKLETVLRNEGFNVDSRLVTGNPAKEISEIADKEGVDVIVMGAHGKGLLTEILLGSVSAAVMRNSPCPVLIIKKGGDDAF